MNMERKTKYSKEPHVKGFEQFVPLSRSDAFEQPRLYIPNPSIQPDITQKPITNEIVPERGVWTIDI